MFPAFDRTNSTYTGELSETTRYAIDHHGDTFDGVIHSDGWIAYADPRIERDEVGETRFSSTARDFWRPIEDWNID